MKIFLSENILPSILPQMKLGWWQCRRKLAKDRAFRLLPERLAGWAPFISRYTPCVQNGRFDNATTQPNQKQEWARSLGQWGWRHWRYTEKYSNSKTSVDDEAKCPFCCYFWLINVRSFGSSRRACHKREGWGSSKWPTPSYSYSILNRSH